MPGKHRYFAVIKESAQERRVADLATGIMEAVTRYAADEVLEYLRTQKVLSKMRDPGAIKKAWRILRGTLRCLHSPQYDEFDHHFQVCARLQEILLQIDQQSLAIPGFTSQVPTFRIRVLEHVERRRRARDAQFARVVTDELAPRDAVAAWTGAEAEIRRMCEAGSILIAENNQRSVTGTPEVSEVEMNALFELAALSELIRQMLDAYSYKEISVKVNGRSTVFGDLYESEFALAAFWASQRRYSDDQITTLPFRKEWERIAKESGTALRNMAMTFTDLLATPAGKDLLGQTLAAAGLLTRRSEAEIEQYFDVSDEITTDAGTFTIAFLLRVWEEIIALALVAELWSKEQYQRQTGSSLIPTVARSRLLELLVLQTKAPTECVDAALGQFTAGSGSRVDLYLTPLVPLGTDHVAIATTYALSSRMHRNLFTQAVHGGRFDQTGKGKRPVTRLRAAFEAANFAAIVNFPVAEHGKAVTDIDIAAIKDGILFLGQSKVVLHPDEAFDFWKARQKLTAAAAQMQRTLQHLRGLLPRLLSRLGWRERVIDTVAFVVTSAWEFSGAHVAGLPVVDFSYLQMLLNGARISAVREEADGKLSIVKMRLIKGLHPTGPELRTMIQESLHQHLARRPAQTGLTLHKIGSFKVHIPTRWAELKVR